MKNFLSIFIIIFCFNLEFIFSALSSIPYNPILRPALIPSSSSPFPSHFSISLVPIVRRICFSDPDYSIRRSDPNDPLLKQNHILTKREEYFGHWEVLDLLNHGKYGKIFLVKNSSTHEFGALKRVRMDWSRSSEEFNTLTEESAFLEQLQVNSNIVRLKEKVYHHGEFGYVMELIRTGDLQEIAEKKLFTEIEAKHIFWRLANLIKWLHSMGVVHRDLKPENIMMKEPPAFHSRSDYIPTLIDFGFMCHADIKQNKHDPNEHRCGSPGYAAPELYKHERIKLLKPLDVYSLGIVFMVTVFGNRKSGELRLHVPESGISQNFRDLLLCMTHEDPLLRCTMEQVVQHRYFFTSEHDYITTASTAATKFSDSLAHLVTGLFSSSSISART